MNNFICSKLTFSVDLSHSISWFPSSFSLSSSECSFIHFWSCNICFLHGPSLNVKLLFWNPSGSSAGRADSHVLTDSAHDVARVAETIARRDEFPWYLSFDEDPLLWVQEILCNVDAVGTARPLAEIWALANESIGERAARMIGTANNIVISLRRLGDVRGLWLVVCGVALGASH